MARVRVNEVAPERHEIDRLEVGLVETDIRRIHSAGGIVMVVSDGVIGSAAIVQFVIGEARLQLLLLAPLKGVLLLPKPIGGTDRA